MSKKLWQKNTTKLHPLVEKYTVCEDNIWDYQVLPYDIEASAAHAAGLLRIGVINKKEYGELVDGLNKLKKEYLAGKIHLTIADEDCHTLIENYLVKHIGTAGKKIHTGRSRNDQILVALRLLVKNEAKSIIELTINLANEFLSQAKKYQDIPLPGHTHHQQAMLSSVGHYLSAFAEQLSDDAALLVALAKHINQNPLGSAAGLGVSFPLDRDYTAQLMGFDEVQINSLYCQNTRG
ncbi:MAG: lyase family protein, partial [Candidatus Magasanikbacteria bacterium]